MVRIVAALFFVVFSLPAQAAGPKAELWARWQAHDPASNVTVDHSAWGRFLSRYLKVQPKDANRVDYAGVSSTDHAALAGYVDQLAAVSVSRLNKAEQLAYWINFYNALTVRVILDHWPVSSIRDIDISPGLFSDGPWGKKLVTVDGEKLSLDDIEHRILRPIWQDPRLHYAVNCASIGCPDLAAKPFSAKDADRLLQAAAEMFVNSPRSIKVDNDGRLTASKIYDWFIDDFGGSEDKVLDHIRGFAAPDLRAKLAGRKDIDGHVYDWRINAVN